MKNIFLIVIVLVIGFVSKAQTPFTTPNLLTGGSTKITQNKGAGQFDSGLVVTPRFTDTASANLSVVSLYGGMLIRVLDTLWMRNESATRWNKVGGSAGSAGSYVDGIYRTPGIDSIYFTISGTTYAIKDSTDEDACDVIVDVLADIPELEDYSGNALTVIVTDSLRGGVFNYYASGLINDDGIVFTATGKGSGFWRRQFIESDGINVQWFGAIGDSLTDCSNAFRAVQDYLNTTSKSNGTSGRKQVINRVFIPAGTYTVSEQGAILDSTFNSTYGFVYEGAGQYLTRIIFPATNDTNSYYLYNNNKVGFITIRDLSFQSLDSSTNFMYSYSTNTAQNFYYERCKWEGQWRYLFRMEGTNLNSEWSMNSCNFNGYYKTAFYTPQANSSDQFVNWSFINCNFEVFRGNFIDFAKGGNINVIGGSYIITDTVSGTLFILRNRVHSSGVQRLLVQGIRVELRTIYAKIIESYWGDGVILFSNMDATTRDFDVDATAINCQFYSNSLKMPSISFDNCILQGRHEYIYDNNSHNYLRNVKYSNCVFSQYDDGNSFIVSTAFSGATATGGRVPVQFENCRGQDNGEEYIEGTLYADKASKAILHKHWLSSKTAFSQLPSAGASITLKVPINSIITKVYLYIPASAVSSSSTAWTYTLSTAEITPTELMKLPTGWQANLGYIYQSNEMFFYADSDEKRTLTLTADANVNQNAPNSFFVVEILK